MNYAVKKENSSTVAGSYLETHPWVAAHPMRIGRAPVIYFPTPESVLDVFRKLASEWKEETLDMSSLTDIVAHPAYLKIIGLGREALPLIIEELRREPNHWFVALVSIAHHDPVLPQQAGNMDQMRQAWLDWAEQNENEMM